MQAVLSRAEDTGFWTLRASIVFFGASASCCQGVSTWAQTDVSLASYLFICVRVYGYDISIPLSASSCPPSSPSFLLFFFLLISLHLTTCCLCQACLHWVPRLLREMQATVLGIGKPQLLHKADTQMKKTGMECFDGEQGSPKFK